MTAVVAVLRTGEAEPAKTALSDLARTLGATGWRVHPDETLRLWRRSDDVGAGVCAASGGCLVGTAFPNVQIAPKLGEALASGERWAQRVSATCWGGYVALRCAAPGAPAVAYRDPSGALPLFVWSWRGLLLAATCWRASALGELRPRSRVCSDVVARWLVDATETAVLSGLEGVSVIAPGDALITDADKTVVTSIWSPATRATASQDTSERAARLQLRGAVDQAASAYAGLGRELLVEISGGLDSAVVGASLVEARASISAGLHLYAGSAEADEREYARATAEILHLDLREILLGETGLDAEMVAGFGEAPIPSFNAVDAPYDEAAARALRRFKAWALVTGQGGDAAFLKLRTPLLAWNAVRRAGWCAALLPEMRELAWRCRTSTWRILGAVGRAASDKEAWPSWSPLFGVAGELKDLRGGGSQHPWYRGLAELEPAKRLQVAGLAFALLNNGDSRRARVAKLIHLPLQQPVLEATLPLPSDLLARAGRDRPLAREAFRDRLAPSVLARTGKGDLTVIYARRLSASLPFLRSWLLEGALSSLRLLNAPELEAALTPEHLFQEGRVADLLKLAVIEAWLRDQAT